jgi:hypothetical protein
MLPRDQNPRGETRHCIPGRGGTFFDRDFLCVGRAFERGRSMLELWNGWYETLVSVEALASVILVAAGVIALAEGRRR